MMKHDIKQRFGFVVNEVGRLYGRRFDQLARERLGLSRAQCRLIAAVAMHEGEGPLTQAELAQQLDLTPMAVATLCDRMEAAGWLQRQPHPSDRRANGIELLPAARKTLASALGVSDELQAQALAGFSASERAQLMSLLRRAHANLQGMGGEGDA